MSTLLVKNAKNIITMDKERSQFPGGSLYAEGQQILAIGTDLPYETADTVIDARDKIVYPGLINTHHHLYQTLTRNIPFAQDCTLFDWLKTLYEIWLFLTPEDVYLSTLVGLGELLKSGCTSSSDHFYCFPNSASAFMLDEEIHAAHELGIRFFPTRGSMNLGRSKGGLPPDELCQTAEEILKDSQRLIETYHDDSRFSMIRIGVAPCSPFSVTEELLRETAQLARSYHVRLHTHLAETIDEEDFCRERLGMRPLEYMEHTGWVGDDVWYAHGIWFNNQEIQTLATSGCGIAHCPVSNMKLSSGAFPILKMRNAGVKIGIGVDGSASNDSSNMLFDLRVGYLLHKHQLGPTAICAEDLLHLGTVGSSRVLGWEDAIGSLEVGKACDLFMIDTRKIGYAGALFDDTALPLLVGSLTVDTTIVGGKVVVSGGRLTNIDEERVAVLAQKAAERMLHAATERTKINYKKARFEALSSQWRI